MSLPVVDPPADRTGDAAVAGVLLAAGTSSRYGDANKLLVDVDGEPMVRRSAETLLDAGLDPVLVVVGYEAGRVRDALAGLDVELVENPGYESGQASSVRAGVRALTGVDSSADDCSVGEGPPAGGTHADAAVFALGDMPYVEPGSVRALVAAYEAGAGSALAAGYEGERGNPVLFDHGHFPALVDSDGDVGGKHVLLTAADAAVVETRDPGVRRDVDEPRDVE